MCVPTDMVWILRFASYICVMVKFPFQNIVKENVEEFLVKLLVFNKHSFIIPLLCYYSFSFLTSNTLINTLCLEGLQFVTSKALSSFCLFTASCQEILWIVTIEQKNSFVVEKLQPSFSLLRNLGLSQQEENHTRVLTLLFRQTLSGISKVLFCHKLKPQSDVLKRF